MDGKGWGVGDRLPMVAGLVSRIVTTSQTASVHYCLIWYGFCLLVTVGFDITSIPKWRTFIIEIRKRKQLHRVDVMFKYKFNTEFGWTFKHRNNYDTIKGLKYIKGCHALWLEQDPYWYGNIGNGLISVMS